MYVDKLELVSIGTKYIKNKEKKNQILNRHCCDDGIILKKIPSLIDAFNDAHHEDQGNVTITVEFRTE
jgi:hypothetical protein